jgi:hypothetical protein
MPYIENPQTKGSGIFCAIPHITRCPIGCTDCFFQSGRSYLEPLTDNLPNIPPDELIHSHIIKINDCNDSNIDRKEVIKSTAWWPHKFYETSIPDLAFPAPIVLTVNPGAMTDTDAHLLDDIPDNLMFVRVRVNTWNLRIVDRVMQHYTDRNVPVVLTFVVYYKEAPQHKDHYTLRKRTTNQYWVITELYWEAVVHRFRINNLAYTCGKPVDSHRCVRCGNCLREYYATMERIQTGGGRI